MDNRDVDIDSICCGILESDLFYAGEEVEVRGVARGGGSGEDQRCLGRPGSSETSTGMLAGGGFVVHARRLRMQGGMRWCGVCACV